MSQDTTEWPVRSRTRPQRAQIYSAQRFRESWGASGEMITEWRWKLYAGNGRIIGASTEGYVERRNLVANLEQTLHLTMLDQDRQLHGPRWYLYGLEMVFGPEVLPGNGQVLQMPVKGVVVPVLTPDPHWTNRR